MTRKEFVEYLVEMGWVKGRDETGALFAVKRIDNMTIDTLPKLHSTPEVEISPTLSIDAFDVAQSYISGRPMRYVRRSIVMKTRMREKVEVTTKEQVKRYSDMMIDWAMAQDIEEGLAVLRALPTAAKGAMPARHLAALAIHPDVKTLRHYRDSFARGDRLDFVPYIDEGYIERSLEIAERRLDDPDWIPEKPKIRL